MILPFHPLAEIFPLMQGAAFDELVADIKAHGLMEPIVLLDGKVLDGRNRLRACEAAGVEPEFDAFTGDKPLNFIISLNLKRRHLGDSQRAMVGERLANMPPHRPDVKDAILHTSRAEAAELVNVSVRSLASAREVLNGGTPELIAAVDQGKIAVSVAAKLAELPKEAQAAAVSEPEKAPHVAKRHARDERERELAAKILALPTGKYGVFFADPPWRFEPWSRETGMDRAADNHYPTPTIEEIKSLNIASIAAADCVLFLCATRPMLPQALEVMEAWGFDYKTCAVWEKGGLGSGYWFRDVNELLLVGVRGKVPAPAQGDQWESRIDAPAGEHSAKPEAFFMMIEDYFPRLPKIELYARKSREGWTAWGFEAPAAGGAAVGDSGN